MIQNLKEEEGFTLTESLVVLFIVLAVTAMTLDSLVRIKDYSRTVETELDLRITGKTALRLMEEELKNATRTAGGSPPNIVIPNTRDEISFFIPGDVDGNGMIVDLVGNTEWTIQTMIKYRYDAGARELIRSEFQFDIPSGTYVLNTEHPILSNVYRTDVNGNVIQPVTFDDLTTDITLALNEVKISLNVQKDAMQNRPMTSSFISVIKLRN